MNINKITYMIITVLSITHITNLQSSQGQAFFSRLITTNLELTQEGTVLQYPRLFYFVEASVPCTPVGLLYLQAVLENKIHVTEVQRDSFPVNLKKPPTIELAPNGLQIHVYGNASSSELQKNIIQATRDFMKSPTLRK